MIAGLRRERDEREASAKALGADKDRALALIAALEADKKSALERIERLETEAQGGRRPGCRAWMRTRREASATVRKLTDEKAAALAALEKLGGERDTALKTVEALTEEKAAALAALEKLGKERDEVVKAVEGADERKGRGRRPHSRRLGDQRDAALAQVRKLDE